ncbi:MAG: FIST signal transduction protein [Chitinophagales bacterium]
MQIQQQSWNAYNGWTVERNENFTFAKPALVLAFGNRFELEKEERFIELQNFYPNSHIILNSTSGEIIGTEVKDGSIVVTAIQFEHTTYEVAVENIKNWESSYAVAKQLVSRFEQTDLRHIFVVSDGQLVNGSELVKGFNDSLSDGITVTGGLAGDDARFQKTLVGMNNQPSEGNIVAIGFYGEQLKVGYGSVGGWNSFGPERIITKSKGNVLYELDGQSALAIYKKYLGPKAEGLPSTALLFPLSIRLHDDEKSLVRTILAIDEEEQSMTFAGDMPEGTKARLMKANFDKLIDGAYDSANSCLLPLENQEAEIALLVSCVGRKLVLDQRIEEEVEGVVEVVGNKAVVTGFYSYGELAPFAGYLNCELHNQTMTVTLLGEK